VVATVVEMAELRLANISMQLPYGQQRIYLFYRELCSESSVPSDIDLSTCVALFSGRTTPSCNVARNGHEGMPTIFKTGEYLAAGVDHSFP
jgi:hypothetical protein